jgi:hypothetical protein
MDEIDAALDFKNVSIVGHYIKVCDGKDGGRRREINHRSKCFTYLFLFWKGSRLILFQHGCL